MEKTVREKNPCSTNLVDLLIQRCQTWRQNRLPLKVEDSPPVIDGDDGSPVSEAPIDEDEDPNEGERQGEEPDLVTDESREIESDQLQRRLTTKQSRKLGRVPELSHEKRKEMESRLKKARANVSELRQDAFHVKSARSKEKKWHSLNGREKLLFLETVSKQWNALQENAAATVIPPAEAKVNWRTLRKQGLQDRVMQSRFVLPDKNEGKSTAENPLDTKASARIVVPRCVDPDVLDIRRDSPTACREAINVLLAVGASTGREKWALLTADVQAAFLKGESHDKDRVLYFRPPKNGPALTGDAPRKWWEKKSKVLVQIGFRKERMCLGPFTLHSPPGTLSGVFCFHVDDMLGTGHELFESKLKELDKLVGFGTMKRQKFVHCGRQYEKHANGEITISMKAYIQNLRKADPTLERRKQLDDELSATESHEFRGINGYLQWVTKELLYPFQFVVKVLQRRQGQARVRDLLKANEVTDEIKQHEDFTLSWI